ncbi:hypothetical protein F5Y12DRAFT_751699 [Xylaria sp. FL1777]|nr:hypothetical protein F5Y12DRAFT_751699 [Xylaria sp. FL1777]
MQQPRCIESSHSPFILAILLVSRGCLIYRIQLGMYSQVITANISLVSLGDGIIFPVPLTGMIGSHNSK